MIKKYIYLIFFATFYFMACKETYTPKPTGYFRIELPEKEYIDFNKSYPYHFAYPTYAKIVRDTSPYSKPCIQTG